MDLDLISSLFSSPSINLEIFLITMEQKVMMVVVTLKMIKVID